MKHLLEEEPRIPFQGDVHLHFERNRAPVGVIGVRVVLGCALGETPGLALEIDLFEDSSETVSFLLEPSLESCQCRWRQFPGHTPPRFGRRR
jgi:hypothetical protein